MRIVDFIVKEFRQLKRDRRLLPFLFAAPVFQLLLFGYAVSTDIKHVKVVVCDQDHTPESRELVRVLTSSEYLDYLGSVESPNAVDRFLITGRAGIALILPHGFGADVRAGRTATAQALLDGSDSNTGTVAQGYLGALVEAHGARLLARRLARAGQPPMMESAVDARVRVWYNPALESKNFMVPGVLCVIVANLTTVLTALTIVREREVGTMEQLMVTPIRPWELMLGKMLPFLIVGYIDIAVIMAGGALIFGVPVRGSLLLLALLSGIFLVAALAIGLLISTISRTQQQAMMAAVFFLMPNILLSGFAWPIENMPRLLQWVTYLLPMRYYLVIVRGIFLKANPLGLLWDQVVPLTVLAGLILLAATLRFQKRLD